MSQTITQNRAMFDFKVKSRFKFKSALGLTKEVILQISQHKKEPDWMLQKRIQAFEIFQKLKMPDWGPSLEKLDLNQITYFAVPDAKHDSKSWDEVPQEIKTTFERLGIPEAERTSLAGTGAQYESLVVYHNLKKEWEEKGVIFEDMDVAVQKYPELVKKYFMTQCVPVNLHKFVALHAAVWSGGTFLFVPKGVKVDLPLQAYFRMNERKGGQFEHTLIIVEEGAQVHYVEGCSAPQYLASSLHAGCVEIIVKEGARARYSSVENWSKNTFNLNTKRAIVNKNAVIEWVGGNMGCLTGDTKLFCNPKGVVDIKNINQGEHVFSFNPQTRRLEKRLVKAHILNGIKEVYKLSAGGRSIKATDNHPFLVVERQKIKGSKKGKFILNWRPLSEINKGDLVAISKQLPEYGESHKLPKININNRNFIGRNQYGAIYKMSSSYKYKKVILPEKTSEDLMWLFGFYVGDGSIWRDGNTVKINLAVPSSDPLRYIIKDKIKNLFNSVVSERDERSIVINSGIIGDFFEACGFKGRAYEKRIPQWIFNLALNERLAFLGGYADADGHIEQGNLYLTSCNKELLEDFKLLAMSCGIGVSRIFKHRAGGKINIIGNDCNSLDSFRLLLSGYNVTEIKLLSSKKINKLNSISRRRNYSTIKGLNFSSLVNENIGFAKVDEKMFVGKEEVYDINVDELHNFVANGFIVHNSGTTMLYPCSILVGEGARADHISVALAGKGQNQDVGSKVYHMAPNTSSTIKSKSISMNGGITTYRGLLKISSNAVNSKSNVNCDALMMDNISVSDTVPYIEVQNSNSDIAHEATVGKISDEQIFYLMSRGLSKDQATQMIVSGFIEPIVKELPLEYAVELNRLVELEMEGSLG